MEIKIVTEDKYLPKYANETDARMDIKAKIKNENPRQLTMDHNGMCGVFTETEDSIYIMPGEVRIIDTGLQVQVPEGYEMNMVVRSSVGIKKHLALANGTGIIDAGYRDEIKMALYNFGTEPQRIIDGDRICQFKITPVEKIMLQQVADNEDFRRGDRGGGIGSTGN